MIRRVGFVLVCLLLFIIVVKGLTGGSQSSGEEEQQIKEQTTAFLEGPQALKRVNSDVEQIILRRQIQSASATDEEKPKRVFLTFDDGPSPTVTPRILDVLDQYQVKGTFFVLGHRIDEHPEIVKETVERGHAVGNHSYSHDYDKIYRSVDAFMEDFYQCEASIRNAVGEDWHGDLVRFPGGSFESYKQPIGVHLNELDYHFFDWNAISGDGESDDYTVEDMVEKFKETASGKRTIIALFHDSESKTKTVDTLGPIIEWLQSEGYEFLTLDER